MNILLVSHNFLPYCLGGVEIYVSQLAHRLLERGHGVRVLYPRQLTTSSAEMSIREGTYDGIPIAEVFTGLSHHDAAWLVHNDRIKPALRQYLAAHPVDVVHAHHLFGLSVSCLDVFEELRIPVILTARDFWLLCFEMHLVNPEGAVCSGPESAAKCASCILARFHEGDKERQRPLFEDFLAKRQSAHREAIRKPRVVLCISRFMQQMFQKYGLVNPSMICMPTGIVHFPLETPPPHAMPPVRIAFLGTINYRKGLDLLIDAFRQVDQSRAQLHIYGAISNQEYFDRTMRSLPPGSPVSYHGPYQAADLPHILAATDVVVVPSRGEAYPQVPRQVLHGKVPVIAANVDGIPEIVEDGRNGLLFRENDANDLAAKLNLLVDEPDRIARLRDGISPIRSIEDDVMVLEDLYRKVSGTAG